MGRVLLWASWRCICKLNSEPDAAQPLPAPSCPSRPPLLQGTPPRSRSLHPNELSVVGTLFCTGHGQPVPGAHRAGLYAGSQFPGAFSSFGSSGSACPLLPPALLRSPCPPHGRGRRECCAGTGEMGSIPGSATSSPLGLASLSIGLVTQSPPELLQGQKSRGGLQNPPKG